MTTVFFDIDTQYDFLFPAGALYVPKAERIVERVAALNRYAGSNGITVISTVDAHAEDDIEFRAWPPHCVAGATGQRKPDATLLDKRVVVPNRAGLPEIAGARQIVVEKQSVNVFDTVTIRPLLEKLAADRFVVYGVVTEICVLHAARGLLKLGKPVTIVSDAIEGLHPGDTARALDELRAAGAVVACGQPA